MVLNEPLTQRSLQLQRREAEDDMQATKERVNQTSKSVLHSQQKPGSIGLKQRVQLIIAEIKQLRGFESPLKLYSAKPSEKSSDNIIRVSSRSNLISWEVSTSTSKVKRLEFVCVFERFNIHAQKKRLPSSIFKGKKLSLLLVNASVKNSTFELVGKKGRCNMIETRSMKLLTCRTPIFHTSTWKLETELGNLLKTNLYLKLKISRNNSPLQKKHNSKGSFPPQTYQGGYSQFPK